MTSFNGLVGKISRFSLVGAANGLIYAVATALFVGWLGLPPGRSSMAGYLVVLPFAYLAHKRFTFRSEGTHRRELLRFVVAFISGLLLSAGLMHLVVSVLGFHYVMGIGAGILCVPLLTLFVLDKWVFQMQGVAPRNGNGR